MARLAICQWNLNLNPIGQSEGGTWISSQPESKDKFFLKLKLWGRSPQRSISKRLKAKYVQQGYKVKKKRKRKKQLTTQILAIA
jgi:hypothetical protein